MKEFDVRQITPLGYTKQEKFIAVAFRGLIIAVAVFLGSLIIIQPIMEILIPSSRIGFMPPSMRCAILGILISGVLGVSCIIAILVCGFVLRLHTNPQNFRRIQPLVINSFVSCPVIIVALVSTFVDYGWFRAWIIGILVIILVTSMIVSYSVYRKRYRQDVRAISSAKLVN